MSSVQSLISIKVLVNQHIQHLLFKDQLSGIVMFKIWPHFQSFFAAGAGLSSLDFTGKKALNTVHSFQVTNPDNFLLGKIHGMKSLARMK